MSEPFTISPQAWAPQVSALNRVMDAVKAGESVVLQSPTGSGKCLDPETPVMLHSGLILPARDIMAGDLLMGPDSLPRKVLSTCTGRGEMYDVTPTKGMAYRVNDAHILTLRMNCNVSGYKKGDLVDICIADYLKESKTFRHCAKGVRAAVNFPPIAPPKVPAYFVGVWLGDGTRLSQVNLTLNTEDIKEIVPSLECELAPFGVTTSIGEQASKQCLSVSFVTARGQANPLRNEMRAMGLGEHKFIPDSIKLGSVKDRLDVLAGLIDTDGYVSGKNGIDLVFKDESLAEDLAFIARSLGLAAYVRQCTKGIASTGFSGEYFRVSVSGETSMIPMRVSRKSPQLRGMNKDVLNVGIKVTSAGRGVYAGFTLDGDGRFLLGDFTITHNTFMASELLRWAAKGLGGGCFYVNRKLLVEQTAARFGDQGLHFGVRAADHEERFDSFAPIQICSADTERSRVYGEKATWARHDCGLVIVDEAHIQKGATMKRIIADHRSNGAAVVFLSATPVSLKKSADRLVVAGSMKQFRDCGALVPAIVKTIEQPDMSKVKRAPTGEFDLTEKKRKIYTQTIVGNVLKYWKEFNPDARPTMLYAPGKAESVWFTQQFEAAGVSWCHVDATDAYFDGKRYSLTRTLWQDILGKYTDGTFKGVSSRFKLREGIDVTRTYHIILATPIGSIQSYLQTVGRGLRASLDAPYHKDHCLVTDHGGNYWRHGSPNIDRDWNLLWGLSNSVASKMHEDAIRNGEAPEPIRCPKCKCERIHGPKCPHCGHEHAKSSREVIQEDGTIVTKEGNLVPRKRVLKRADTQRLWDDMYFGFKRKGLSKTFSQMEAFFVHQHGYWPARTLANMPTEPANWYRNVKDVPMQDLRPKQ